FIDTLLALCTTVALLAGRIACRRPAINLWWWSISAMACGLGVLAKGPVAVVLCVPPLLAGRWLTGCGGIRIKQALAYAGIVGLVSVPWFLLVNARQSGFLADFFWTHHFNRFVSGLSHAEPWWYYLPVLLVGMLPCSILFPAIAAFLFDRGNTTRLWRSWDIGFLALASGWTLLTFSLASCKLPPYLLPAVPAICLIVGRGLEAILSGKLDNRFLYFVRQRSPHHLIGILLSAGMICGAIDLWILEGLAAGRGAHWAILVLGGTAAAIASWKGLLDRRLKAWAAAGVLAVVSMAAANLDFYPGVATKRSKVAPVVDLCHSKIDRSTPVVCFSLSHEADSMAFRLGGCQLQNYEFSELDAAVSALSGPGEFIVLANTTEVHVLRERLPAGLMLAELGQYEHIFVGVCSAAPQATARR
ncbi:MAG TPA: hypothetical protein VKU82_02170, partial [Planctomycetaceae bacterium]|nr:hypothetical protein [Planctomycetaceae bacterium]